MFSSQALRIELLFRKYFPNWNWMEIQRNKIHQSWDSLCLWSCLECYTCSVQNQMSMQPEHKGWLSKYIKYINWFDMYRVKMSLCKDSSQLLSCKHISFKDFNIWLELYIRCTQFIVIPLTPMGSSLWGLRTRDPPLSPPLTWAEMFRVCRVTFNNFGKP